MKTIALDFLKKGYSIFPCGSDKKPLLMWQEFQKRKPTIQEVETWWTNFPKANIGIVTGKISGITVIDCDIGSNYEDFPETFTVRTGSGGYHLYYLYEEGVGNKAGILPNVDIRGEGGFVVAAGSRTENKIENGVLIKLGGSYEVVKALPFARFPKSVLIPKTTDKEHTWESLRGVGMGSRNQSAAQITGKLIKAFKKEEWEQVWSLLEAWNNANNPPLEVKELRSVFEGICKREEEGIPAEQEDVEVLPISEVAERNKIKTPAIATGLLSLDNLIKGGVHQGDLIVISGATGMGKTFLAQSFTYFMANNKTPTLWFSYEVGISNIWEKFQEMGARDDFISYSPLKMITGNVEWIEKKIKESIEKYGTKIIFIDHLGYLTKDLIQAEKSANYSLYLTAIVRKLKRIAIDNNITIFLLAHRIQDRNKKDETSDIAHSSGIAQEADLVLMIRREQQEKGEEVYTNLSTLSVTKNRLTGQTKKMILENVNGKLQESEKPLNPKQMVIPLNRKIAENRRNEDTKRETLGNI